MTSSSWSSSHSWENINKLASAAHSTLGALLAALAGAPSANDLENCDSGPDSLVFMHLDSIRLQAVLTQQQTNVFTTALIQHCDYLKSLSAKKRVYQVHQLASSNELAINQETVLEAVVNPQPSSLSVISHPPTNGSGDASMSSTSSNLSAERAIPPNVFFTSVSSNCKPRLDAAPKFPGIFEAAREADVNEALRVHKSDASSRLNKPSKAHPDAQISDGNSSSDSNVVKNAESGTRKADTPPSSYDVEKGEGSKAALLLTEKRKNQVESLPKEVAEVSDFYHLKTELKKQYSASSYPFGDNSKDNVSIAFKHMESFDDSNPNSSLGKNIAGLLEKLVKIQQSKGSCQFGDDELDESDPALDKFSEEKKIDSEGTKEKEVSPSIVSSSDDEIEVPRYAGGSPANVAQPARLPRAYLQTVPSSDDEDEDGNEGLEIVPVSFKVIEPLQRKEASAVRTSPRLKEKVELSLCSAGSSPPSGSLSISTSPSSSPLPSFAMGPSMKMSPPSNNYVGETKPETQPSPLPSNHNSGPLPTSHAKKVDSPESQPAFGSLAALTMHAQNLGLWLPNSTSSLNSTNLSSRGSKSANRSVSFHSDSRVEDLTKLKHQQQSSMSNYNSQDVKSSRSADGYEKLSVLGKDVPQSRFVGSRENDSPREDEAHGENSIIDSEQEEMQEVRLKMWKNYSSSSSDTCHRPFSDVVESLSNNIADSPFSMAMLNSMHAFDEREGLRDHNLFVDKHKVSVNCLQDVDASKLNGCKNGKREVNASTSVGLKAGKQKIDVAKDGIFSATLRV